MIQTEKLSFAYKKGQNVLTNLNLNFNKGNIYGILGKNGVGKTTLLYNILGLLKPTSGKALLNDQESLLRTKENLQESFFIMDTISFQKLSLKNYLSINSVFYPKFSTEQFYTYLDMFNMPHEIKNLTQLSLGEQKKVFLSFALACNTNLVIMDEPTNGLDIPSKSEFRKALLYAMNDERCIIISTHQVNDIENILDNVTIFDNKELILNSSISKIANNLLFSENANAPIYSQPTISGEATISINNNNEESKVSLELLFNALHSNAKEQILNEINK